MARKKKHIEGRVYYTNDKMLVGDWAQGVYGFKTREQALNYAKYMSYKKRRF